MAKKLTQKKAKMILKDGTVRGKRLTKKQRAFFGAIAGGAKMKKGVTKRKKSAGKRTRAASKRKRHG